jgi:hypothetical protein
MKLSEKDKQQIKDDIEMCLKYALPLWECEDKDDYMYLVKPVDLDRAILSLSELFIGIIKKL